MKNKALQKTYSPALLKLKIYQLIFLNTEATLLKSNTLAFWDSHAIYFILHNLWWQFL